MESLLWLCPTAAHVRCQWVGRSPHDVVSHFRAEHEDLLVLSNVFPVSTAGGSTENKLLCLGDDGDRTYLVQTRVDPKEGVLKLRLRYLGSREDASGLSYRVQIRVGRFAFEAFDDVKCNAVHVKDGFVEADLQLIALATGSDSLESVTCFLDINRRVSATVPGEGVNGECGTQERGEEALKDEKNSKKEDAVDSGVGTEKSNEEAVDSGISTQKSNFKRILANHRPKSFDASTKSINEVNNNNHSPIKEAGSNHNTSPSHLEKYKRPTPAIRRNNSKRDSFLEHFFFNDCDEASSSGDDKDDTDNEHLRCSSCQAPDMHPPIFLCGEGHSVCGRCKFKPCALCGYSITDIRNADLEEMSRKQMHSCKYRENGCVERHWYKEIRMHEVSCRYNIYKCCLCPTEGKFTELRTHFKLLHSSTRIFEGLVNKFPKNTAFAVVNCDVGILYCHSLLTSQGIEWTVTSCGPPEQWFSCELRIKGKKTEVSYALKRPNSDNRYSLTLTQGDLKATGLKDKYAVLHVSCY